MNYLGIAEQEQAIIAYAVSKVEAANALAVDWSGHKYYGFRLNTAPVALQEKALSARVSLVSKILNRFSPKGY